MSGKRQFCSQNSLSKRAHLETVEVFLKKILAINLFTPDKAEFFFFADCRLPIAGCRLPKSKIPTHLSMRSEAFPTIRLAVPIIIGELAQMSLHIIDSAMVGAISYKQLAATSLVISAVNIPFVIGIGMTISVSQMVSMAHGRRDSGHVSHYLFNGFWLCAATAIIISLSMVLGRGILFHLGQDEDVVELALPFMKLIGLSLIPMLLFMTLKQFTDGLEYTKTAMLLSLCAMPVNIFLNWLLIYGNLGFPRLELVGAGWATPNVSRTGCHHPQTFNIQAIHCGWPHTMVFQSKNDARAFAHWHTQQFADRHGSRRVWRIGNYYRNNGSGAAGRTPDRPQLCVAHLYGVDGTVAGGFDQGQQCLWQKGSCKNNGHRKKHIGHRSAVRIILRGDVRGVAQATANLLQRRPFGSCAGHHIVALCGCLPDIRQHAGHRRGIIAWSERCEGPHLAGGHCILGHWHPLRIFLCVSSQHGCAGHVARVYFRAYFRRSFFKCEIPEKGERLRDDPYF